MIAWLEGSAPFPPMSHALAEPNGLLAAGGDLSPGRLLAAYRLGIFPWYMPGEPILWWSPNPRMVLEPATIHVPRSLAKVIRHRPYTVTFDTAFTHVMRGCASPRDGDPATWISDDIIAGYTRLHLLGYAHSAECWIDGKLAGGLYGVAIGKMFYGESMFALQPDASKIAFVHLVQWLAGQGFGLIDCQMHTAHLARFGASEIPRDDFTARLQTLITEPDQPGPWIYRKDNGQEPLA
ncbi:leucyl/phenylalanyl-tRNA--protein transferase [Andreprevotia lacus DSM 23236]|jgi:leucyl/phenylalanyl-tRNA--protein transferase|uniref:Leucyl/phenylalanyl-tRNA--protein transferase n=1 Tax=Andreprevotia lacus DSM 23236 TaxID=1121001 RepID=A0A1W1XQW1_9NEIS|nr:leucyl/phenylalanyl-tRNA--protein transferase [Andreprevotia lacus]SMC26267.1 leucyl/phenylalanyl-tRNA--protein transferase [Andreprevotia lacus DSM 23236]